VPYPTSCSPQAWAAAAPFEILRMALNLHPNAVDNVFRASVVPEAVGEVIIDGLAFGNQRISISANHEDVTVSGLPDSVRFELIEHGVDRSMSEAESAVSSGPQ
jgi:hypothetical protein